MPITPSDLATAWSTRYETLFQAAFSQSIAITRAELGRILMELPLGDYQGDRVDLNWLGAAPQMRVWTAEKRALGLSKYNWTATVANYEASVEIDMNTFMDSRGNVYEPRFQEMGQNGGRLPYNLISDLINGGAAALCYDGQLFFDTDHSEGDSGTQSNKLTGSGTSQAQIQTDFYAAKAALCGFKDDKGVALYPGNFRPLVWIPNDATLMERFSTLQGASMISNTANVLANTFDILVDPRISGSDWYMFRTDGVLKPFIMVMREEPHYEDNFDSKSGDVFSRRIGMASVVGRMVATYGMWQQAVMINN